MSETAQDVRAAARAGWHGLTVGRAPGFVQANLFVVPHRFVADFEAFCRANPQACPLLAVGRAGDPVLDDLGTGIDVRTDLPAYLVHRAGRSVPAQTLVDAWRDDSVAFAIGCWFGAESALHAAGVRLRHVELGIQGPLFRTTRAAVSVGPFRPNVVVSMRPFRTADVPEVVRITSRLPRSHGAPLHIGAADALGIADASRPDWGEPLCAGPEETSMFWGCGLTALAALQSADVPEFFTHAPGSMLVTDLAEGLPACN